MLVSRASKRCHIQTLSCPRRRASRRVIVSRLRGNDKNNGFSDNLVSVKVNPKASRDRVERIDDSSFKVYTQKPAADGKANKAVIKALSDYLSVKKNRITIVHGLKFRNKIINIKEEG